jgi:hypothetical protein
MSSEVVTGNGNVSEGLNGNTFVQEGPWSRAEDNYLLSNWGKECAREIGLFLGRSKGAVGGRARRLGLSEPHYPPPADKLTESEVKRVRRLLELIAQGKSPWG